MKTAFLSCPRGPLDFSGFSLLIALGLSLFFSNVTVQSNNNKYINALSLYPSPTQHFEVLNDFSKTWMTGYQGVPLHCNTVLGKGKEAELDLDRESFQTRCRPGSMKGRWEEADWKSLRLHACLTECWPTQGEASNQKLPLRGGQCWAETARL